ncbi:MAG: hypothetical protein WA323_16765, partial [Candidatus Nitrosopolaris sp.]
MTSIMKSATVLVVIAALAGMLAVSSVAAHNAFADDAKTVTVTKNINNKGVDVQTDTNQKEDCLTAGETSPISNSCHATSSDTVTQSGG